MGRNNTGFTQMSSQAGTTHIVMPDIEPPPPEPKKEKKPKNPHEETGTSYGVVYANDVARSEIEKPNPVFPVGSIIVREKHLSVESETPELVIAMVKREKGFSKKTGDWEFFVLDSTAENLTQRETRGKCAECHSQTKKTDWVFRDFLKSNTILE
ncbi:MAG: cytochrome P460 family protein [Pyrinomonadaceae bacterium]